MDMLRRNGGEPGYENKEMMAMAVIARLSKSGWSALSMEMQQYVANIILGSLPKEYILELTILICEIRSSGVHPEFQFSSTDDGLLLRTPDLKPNDRSPSGENQPMIEIHPENEYSPPPPKRINMQLSPARDNGATVYRFDPGQAQAQQINRPLVVQGRIPDAELLQTTEPSNQVKRSVSRLSQSSAHQSLLGQLSQAGHFASIALPSSLQIEDDDTRSPENFLKSPVTSEDVSVLDPTLNNIRAMLDTTKNFQTTPQNTVNPASANLPELHNNLSPESSEVIFQSLPQDLMKLLQSQNSKSSELKVLCFDNPNYNPHGADKLSRFRVIYVCSFCGKQATTATQIRSHFKCHTGEKPYQCEICAKSFKEKGHLKRHLLTHSVERPFKCENCNFSCKDSSNLRKHERRCNPEAARKHQDGNGETRYDSNVDFVRRLNSQFDRNGNDLFGNSMPISGEFSNRSESTLHDSLPTIERNLPATNIMTSMARGMKRESVEATQGQQSESSTSNTTVDVPRNLI